MGGEEVPASNGEADNSGTDKPSGEWWSIINTLASSRLEPHQKPLGPSSDLHVVSTIRFAIAAASEDRAWQDSGVVAHLQSALDIASQGDCDGAKAAALGLTDFVSIAQRNAPPSDVGNAAAAPPLGSDGGHDMPWEHGEHEGAAIHKSTSWDACTLGTEALHTRSDNSRGGGGGSTGSGGGGGTGSGGSDSSTEEAAAAAVAAVDTGDGEAGGQPSANSKSGGNSGNSSSSKGPPKFGARGDSRGRSNSGRGLRRTWASEPDGRPMKRQRAESPPPPTPARSLSDPGVAAPLRRSNSASAIGLTPVRGGGGSAGSEAQQAQPGSGGSGGGGAAPNIVGTAAADEGFPGHNSVVDVHPASKLLRQAKNATDGSTANSSYWAGKVKHRLGSSTVELFFLSALLPSAIIEHMPPSLFVTDLVQRNSLAIGSEHTVIRCRLDFLTNRQLRKLRTLAELRLAAVSSLQHCAITLVPYLDAQRGLRIIGFVKVDKE